MRDLGEYLQAYWSYVSAHLGWGKALRFALLWLAGMFVPLGVREIVQLPEWVAITWMVSWALLGYVFAPYGMWKHHRAQTEVQINQSENNARQSGRSFARDSSLLFDIICNADPPVLRLTNLS